MGVWVCVGVVWCVVCVSGYVSEVRVRVWVLLVRLLRVFESRVYLLLPLLLLYLLRLLFLRVGNWWGILLSRVRILRLLWY